MPRLRTVGTAIIAGFIAIGLALPAFAHISVSGDLNNDGTYVFYTRARNIEATTQKLQLDDLPGRPFTSYIRDGSNNPIGNNPWWKEWEIGDDGEWRTYSAQGHTNWALGKTFYITAKKDADYWWGDTDWTGTLHY